jgi:hypothetical protein
VSVTYLAKNRIYREIGTVEKSQYQFKMIFRNSSAGGFGKT